MSKIIGLSGLLCLSLLAACGDSSKPDPNRSDERLMYEQGVMDECYVKNITSIGRISREELMARCDPYFKEKVGYTYTEAQESLKQRKIPD